MEWDYMQEKVEKTIDRMMRNSEVAYLAYRDGKLERTYLEYLAAYDAFVSENVPEDIMDYREPEERKAILMDIISGASSDMGKLTGQDEAAVGIMITQISLLLRAYRDEMEKVQ